MQGLWKAVPDFCPKRRAQEVLQRSTLQQRGRRDEKIGKGESQEEQTEQERGKVRIKTQICHDFCNTKLLLYVFRLEKRKTRLSDLAHLETAELVSCSSKRRGQKRPLATQTTTPQVVQNSVDQQQQVLDITNATVVVQEDNLGTLNITTAEIYPQQQNLQDHLQPLGLPDAFKNLPLVLPHDAPVVAAAAASMSQPTPTVTHPSTNSLDVVKVEELLDI